MGSGGSAITKVHDGPCCSQKLRDSADTGCNL